MVLPCEAANKEKENLKNGHKCIDDANMNLKSKEMKPRNQKSAPSNKRKKCNSCSAMLCHWEKWGEYLVEAGQSKEESVVGVNPFSIVLESSAIPIDG
jgi:hypothetical protein